MTVKAGWYVYLDESGKFAPVYVMCDQDGPIVGCFEFAFLQHSAVAVPSRLNSQFLQPLDDLVADAMREPVTRPAKVEFGVN